MDETHNAFPNDIEFDDDLKKPADIHDSYDELVAGLPKFDVIKFGKNIGVTKLNFVTRAQSTWSTPLPRTKKGEKFVTWSTPSQLLNRRGGFTTTEGPKTTTDKPVPKKKLRLLTSSKEEVKKLPTKEVDKAGKEETTKKEEKKLKKIPAEKTEDKPKEFKKPLKEIVEKKKLTNEKSQKIAETAIKKVKTTTEKTTQKTTETTSQKTTETTTERITKAKTQKTTETTSQKTTESTSEATTIKVPKKQLKNRFLSSTIPESPKKNKVEEKAPVVVEKEQEFPNYNNFFRIFETPFRRPAQKVVQKTVVSELPEENIKEKAKILPTFETKKNSPQLSKIIMLTSEELESRKTPSLHRTMNLNVKSNKLTIETTTEATIETTTSLKRNKFFRPRTTQGTIETTAAPSVRPFSSPFRTRRPFVFATATEETTLRPSTRSAFAWSRTWSRGPDGVEVIKTWDKNGLKVETKTPSPTTTAPTTTRAYVRTNNNIPVAKPIAIKAGDQPHRGFFVLQKFTIIPGPTFNCKVLDAATDGKPSEFTDTSCNLSYPGFSADGLCQCTYEVDGRDENGCAIGYLYTCTPTSLQLKRRFLAQRRVLAQRRYHK